MLPRVAPAAALLVAVLAAPCAAGKAALAELPERYREWLTEVEPLISKQERLAFLELEKDYQRDAFIRRFWEARNPDPGSRVNRFKERFYQRRAEALEKFGTLLDDRARFWVLHGEPSAVFETDCALILWPIQLWHYGYAELLGRELRLVFYQPAAGGRFKLWRPGEGLDVLIAMRRDNLPFGQLVRRYCASLFREEIEALLERIKEYTQEGPHGPVLAEVPPPVLDPEWLRTFHAFSTDAAADAPPLPTRVTLRYPGRHGQRIVVEGELGVPSAEAVAATLADREAYNFQLTGEVLRDEELFESFRYRFDLPVRGERPEELSLVFERYLRPGDYRLVLKLEDLNGAGVSRQELALEVPSKPAAAQAERRPGEEPAPAAAEERQPTELAGVELTSQGVDLVSGMARFAARVTGEAVRKVSFLLDGRPILTKTRPPYSVELDLGDLPATRRVRVVALDAAGREVATDEVVINPGEHVFAVRLIEPRRGERYAGRVRARAEVQLPEGRRLERLDLYLGEERVASLYQEPFVQTLPLPGDGLAFVRAVAVLEDGNTSEDLVVFNTPDFIEEVRVRLVEVFASVRDLAGRPLRDLRRDEVRVLENGVEQQLLRFEQLENLPIYAALLVDTSASMGESLDIVRQAALAFFQSTIRPRDRAAVVTFSEKPRLAARFTADLDSLAGALAGLRAESSTALYDSLMFGLYYFRGVSGQRALVVLSDGQDRRSETSFREVLEFAGGSGVTIYSIGLGGGRVGRGQLTRLAEATGGRAFFPDSAEELPAIYEVIQGELRSRYLLAYQAGDAGERGFRSIDVRVSRPQVEVRALSGYFP